MKILLATGNQGKKKELVEAFGSLEEISFLSLSDFPEVVEPEEPGDSFEENALIKAQYYAEAFQMPTLAEDSGLTLEAFPGKFGVRTRREIAADTDVGWLEQFLTMLEGLDNRRAVFSSAISFVDPSRGEEVVFLGETSGTITEFPQAPLEKGVPVSAVFIPDGSEVVYSAMTASEKNRVSHRGKAARQMEVFLVKWNENGS